MEKDIKSFRINRGKGFQVTFPNGYTLSTQFGEFNYCEHYPTKHIEAKPIMTETIDHQSKNAEIAIIDGNGDWATREAHADIFNEILGDDVRGYVGIADWFKYLEWTAKKKV